MAVRYDLQTFCGGIPTESRPKKDRCCPAPAARRRTSAVWRRQRNASLGSLCSASWAVASQTCAESSQENSRKVSEKPTWELNIPTHLSHLKSSTCSRWYLDPWVPRGFPETTLNPHNISAFVSTTYWWIFGSEAVESDDDAWIIV